MIGTKILAKQALVCRVRTLLLAIPLESVVETMRPLPVEPFGACPRFVLGLAMVRGEPMPVVDLGCVLGGDEPGCPTRFVTVRTGQRRVALGVDEVVGVRTIARESLQELPALVRHAGEDTVGAIGSLDAELLLVLRGSRIVPEDVFATMQAGGRSI